METRITRYFIGRQAINSIKEIQCGNGEVASSPEDIKVEAERHFREFLQHKPADFEGISVDDLQTMLPYRCPKLDKQKLIKEVTSDEVRRVLFGMPNDKSPGPDGYTAEFYKSAWNIIVYEIQS